MIADEYLRGAVLLPLARAKHLRKAERVEPVNHQGTSMEPVPAQA